LYDGTPSARMLPRNISHNMLVTNYGGGNGAVDNATGTAALVALAEGYTKAGAPDRSVVFLAVTAEESGLLGSKYYAENPVFP
jgi:Zn-dependent M28 family amino/carboxypeptidase